VLKEKKKWPSSRERKKVTAIYATGKKRLDANEEEPSCANKNKVRPQGTKEHETHPPMENSVGAEEGHPGGKVSVGQPVKKKKSVKGKSAPEGRFVFDRRICNVTAGSLLKKGKGEKI